MDTASCFYVKPYKVELVLPLALWLVIGSLVFDIPTKSKSKKRNPQLLAKGTGSIENKQQVGSEKHKQGRGRGKIWPL